MNIAKAKEEIVNTLRVYHKKDENGMYMYPPIRQRPILLMGPPGIGKTAIIAQAAAQAGCPMVAYTMTHHTRQSAIGLPHIVNKEYDGEEVTITEYTLSEIIASVKECIKRTGSREGILFLDEINCVSETLTPIMLSLLQNKTFGTHKVPDGWMIVAAGNPIEYNRSAKEFDIVTMDRVRRINIEPDLDCWMEYAGNKGVHDAVLSFLRIRPDAFYEAKSSAAGNSFVTARGWEDLSALLAGYEQIGVIPEEEQIRQFLGNEKTASSFASFYRLYCKYGDDYAIDRILSGDLLEEEYEQRTALASAAAFEERLTIVGLLLGSIKNAYAKYATAKQIYEQVFAKVESYKRSGMLMGEYIEREEAALDTRIRNDLIGMDEARKEKSSIRALQNVQERLLAEHISNEEKALHDAFLEDLLQEKEDILRNAAVLASDETDRALAFCEEAFSDGQEMILMISQIARNAHAMTFLSDYPNAAFVHWSSQLI